MQQCRKGDSQQFLSYCQRMLLKFVRRDDLVNQSECQSLFRSKTAPQQAKLFGRASTNEAGKADWTKGGNQSLSDCRNAEYRITGGNAQVTGECNLQTTAQAVTMNSAESDGIETCQRRNTVFPRSEPFACKIALRQFLGIKTATKCSSLSADNDHVRFSALCQVIGSSNQVLYPRPVGGIQRLWTIEA